MFKLDEPALLGSKKIAYKYARISRYPWHIKNGIKDFREKHPGSIIMLKMVNDPLRVWKENHSITMFRCYFDITNILTTSLSSAQHSEKIIKLIMLESGSKAMIKFGL